MPGVGKRISAGTNYVVNRFNADYHLQKVKEYQDGTYKVLEEYVEQMPEDLHSALHVRYDELRNQNNQLSQSKKRNVDECRVLKHDAKDLNQRTEKSSQVVDSDKLWGKKDKQKAAEKPKGDLHKAASYSHFGLTNIVVPLRKHREDDEGSLSSNESDSLPTPGPQFYCEPASFTPSDDEEAKHLNKYRTSHPTSSDTIDHEEIRNSK
ncbi:hypothetical protein B0H21DRAFT_771605 [Amylocystis lapponica]|nr:hypothetical protein B0H21DRAFT_771605 [Amylocystis lapponica]